MAQLEDGYTRVANEILTNVAKLKLNGTQHSILLIVWRYTYGFGRKESKLALSFIAEAIEKDKRQVQRELTRMIDMGILTEKETPNFNTTRILSFNKNFRQQVVKKTTGGESTISSVGESTISSVGELDNQERKHKENIKKPSFDYKSVFDFYLTLDLIKHKKYTKEIIKAIKHAKDNLSVDEEEMKRMLKRHEEKVIATKNAGKYKTKKRPIVEFFGQKKVDSIKLICSDYLDENSEIDNPINKKRKEVNVVWVQEEEYESISYD